MEVCSLASGRYKVDTNEYYLSNFKGFKQSQGESNFSIEKHLIGLKMVHIFLKLPVAKNIK